MKQHRVRTVPSTDDKSEPHLLVEMKRDLWLELAERPNHASIHAHNDKEDHTGKHCIGFATRAFRIFSKMRNYTEHEPIC